MKHKRSKKSTFSDAPKWYNKRQTLNYERDKRLKQIEINFIERMASGTVW